MPKEWDPKYPDGPPANYDPENPYKDRWALVEMREYRTRRKAIEMEKAKLLKEKLRECYLREGVNHLQNCRELALIYLESIKDIGYHSANSGPFDKQKW